MAAFQARSDATNRNLKHLARMMRVWSNYVDAPISGMLIDTLAYQFIENYPYRDKSFQHHGFMARDFFDYLSKQDALKEFKHLFHDDPDIANSVTDPNVLPESFKVKMRDASKVDAVLAEFNTKPGVDQVVTPTKAIKQKLDNAKRTREILIVLALVLAVCAGVLIVNTIRLAIFARRREIEVMKLVGASNWFVRVPFMAEGFVQGLVGGLVAAGGMFLIKWGYYHFHFYEKNFFLTNSDALYAGVIVLALGAVLGIFSSWFGLWRRLDV